MMKVRINIDGVSGLGRDEDTVSMMTEGSYSPIEGGWRVGYEENEAAELDGTKTAIKIYDDCVVVDRHGKLTARMEFRPGSSSRFPYKTEYGLSLLGIHTRKLKTDFNEDGGSLSIRYMVDIDHLVSSENRLDMTVRKI